MKACKPLQTEMNQMTRGIPEHALLTLDGMLNNRYKNINAMIMPPLALALNDPKTSLTRRRDIQDFKDKLAEALDSIELLCKHVANNRDNRPRSQFYIC